MFRAQWLPRNGLQLALLLRRSGRSALEDKLGDVTSIEVLKKLLKLTHDSNVIGKIFCESNYDSLESKEFAFSRLRSTRTAKTVRLTALGGRC
jgi:hypothetical protein